MKPREIFLASLHRQPMPRAATGSATSVVTTDLMNHSGVWFPEAHLDANKMVALSETAVTVLGFDNIMPLFSVWHESAALGCEVDWGDRSRMPTGKPCCSTMDANLAIPRDFLLRRSCTVPLEVIRELKRRHGGEVAILGKVFGPWTLCYHVFGVEPFLIATLLQPDAVRRAAFAAFAVAAAAGLALVAVSGTWWLLAVGAAAIVAAWYYTGGRHPYGYAGLGEVFVFVFFGLVAVLGTTYTQALRVSAVAVLAAVAVGALACAILVANNLRDVPTDAAAGTRGILDGISRRADPKDHRRANRPWRCIRSRRRLQPAAGRCPAPLL